MLALFPALTDEVPSSFSFGGHLASKSFLDFRILGGTSCPNAVPES
jgi:hypothetical protein